MLVAWEPYSTLRETCREERLIKRYFVAAAARTNYSKKSIAVGAYRSSGAWGPAGAQLAPGAAGKLAPWVR